MYCLNPRIKCTDTVKPVQFGSCAATSISTRISSSPKRETPTQVQIGSWSGIHFLKFRTIAASASLLIGTWYEFTRKTCDQPFPPASFRLRSTFSKARSICALISVGKTSLWGSHPPVGYYNQHSIDVVVERRHQSLPWPAHSMRSPMRTAWLYLKFFFAVAPFPGYA